MDIALIYTPDTDDAAEALAQAHDLAAGIGSEGENISVLGDATGEWIAGGTREDAEVIVKALNTLVGQSTTLGDPDALKAIEIINAITAQITPEAGE